MFKSFFSCLNYRIGKYRDFDIMTNAYLLLFHLEQYSEIVFCHLHFVKIPNTSGNIWTLRFEIRFMPHRLSILRQRRAWPTIWMDNKFFTLFSLKMWRNCERYQNCVACWTLAGSQIELSQLENNFSTWFALLIKKKRQWFYLLLTIF